MSCDPEEICRIAREVILDEAEALQASADRLDEAFVRAVELILAHKGKLVVTGVGKSGHVAHKLVGTLCSTGTPAVFLHPGEALHGDLGIYQPGDPTILLSKSGSTLELVRLVPTLREFNSPLIAILGNMRSPLAENADVVLNGSVSREADPLGIVPTSSATVSMVLGDALASALMRARGFRENDFARFHPSGQLGRSLTLRVRDVMHQRENIACVSPTDSVRDAVIAMTEYPLGAALVLDEDNHLLGIVTDGDIRRALRMHDEISPLSVSDLMTANPLSVTQDSSLAEATKLMEDRPSQISVLPVCEAQTANCLGLLRIHDIYQPNLI